MVSNCPKLKMYHVRYCTILRKVTAAAKRNYYDKLLDPAENKTKLSRNIIRNETGKVQNVNHTPSVFNLNQSSIHTDNAADTFNYFFLSLVDSLKMDNVNIDLTIS
jgi:hypothetical protein